MKTRLPLCREQFHFTPEVLLESDDFRVELFRYPAGVEAVRIHNRRGSVTVLPFFGQMIWDAQFEGHTLTMGHSFKQPLPGTRRRSSAAWRNALRPDGQRLAGAGGG